MRADKVTHVNASPGHSWKVLSAQSKSMELGFDARRYSAVGCLHATAAGKHYSRAIGTAAR